MPEWGSSVKRWYRISRVAWFGMVVTIIAIAVGALLASASTRRLTTVVAESTALVSAYTRTDEAVVAERSLERQYRLNPDPSVRRDYERQKENVLVALDDIERIGTAEDRALVKKVRFAHSYYDSAIQRLFDAVDTGSPSLAYSIESNEVGPAFDELDELLDTGAERHVAAAERAVENLYRVEGTVTVAAWVGSAFGMALAFTFGLLLARYQRELVRQAADSRHHATHDPLTGLPNRTLFTDRLGETLAGGLRDGTELTILRFDLDRFKEVNDVLGHHHGDLLLRQVAARLCEALRASDTVARLSGDEFAVLLAGTGAEAGHRQAERLLRELHRSFTLDTVTVDVEVSVGMAVAPLHADRVDDLMRCADLALFQAKDAKTGVVVYDPDMVVDQPNRLVLLGDLRRAMEQPDELVLHYQPKVGLRNDRLCGVEALVRWRHPVRGVVSPAEFIPVAESTGLINRLTAHVLAMAVAQARTWLDEGLEVPIAVNLSPRCLLDPDLLGRVRELLVEHGVPARALRLEVTETAVMANPALALRTLNGLHDLGVRLSIDDYGTGYSSMAYLRRLPVDELKVDRSFVTNMSTSDHDAVLVRSAVDLGHNLGLTVVAEGVETAGQVEALRDLGCDIAQGFHYARPMPPAELAGWLRDGGRDPRVPAPVRMSGAR
ncbi:hypothetical protein Voc01_053770 [Virgisporangium ochraceum]|uniref:Diguanylate cyclase/phosphodiesterase n=1 Tax=Virgisporangium ochraceum TaxID=65505 RepID=A0A8J3ZZQ6_9ACTN|nr:hypothetical protein Voc01_053770 [Virgisporangium ochraceum]